MNNDFNYGLLLLLTPTPTPSEAVKMLVMFNFKSIAKLSEIVLRTHTSIHRVLAGENLPLVRAEIIRALGLSLDPWKGLNS